jgi:hypothetical protein
MDKSLGALQSYSNFFNAGCNILPLPSVHGELSRSCGDRSFVQASTVPVPAVRIETDVLQLYSGRRLVA